MTPFSGSICRAKSGQVDPVALGSEEIDPDFALHSTFWYAFRGTGGPMVARLDQGGLFGVALYRTDGVPVATDGLNCARLTTAGPARFAFSSEEGARYLLQVGDTRYWGGESIVNGGYFLSVATAAPNSDRSHAIDLPLKGSAVVSNFNGALVSPAPACSNGIREYVGGRGSWGKISLASAGSLRVLLEQGAQEPGSVDMIALYRDGAELASPLQHRTVQSCRRRYHRT